MTQDGNLIICDAESGSILWRGMPDGQRVQSASKLEETDDVIVLLDFASKTAPYRFSNLLRCRKDGSVVWRADLPVSGADAYTEFEWRNSKLLAFSWSGFTVEVDVSSGSIKEKIFTK